jgi:hypothetical protein
MLRYLYIRGNENTINTDIKKRILDLVNNHSGFFSKLLYSLLFISSIGLFNI